MVEVPLLFEKNLESFFDLIICVIAKDKIRMKRLIKRGMKKDDIKQREKNQFDQKFKMKHSDIIIDNSSSYEVLKEKVLGIYNLIKKLT
jgi:dephospho-CoA kinase